MIDIGSGPGHYAVALAARGAARVLGVDFAPGWSRSPASARTAPASATAVRFARRLPHLSGDETFDYAIVMGFMDYIEEPRGLIEKVLRVCRGKAFFSFPADGGSWHSSAAYVIDRVARCSERRDPHPVIGRRVGGEIGDRRSNRARLLRDPHRLTVRSQQRRPAVVDEPLGKCR